MRLSGRVWKFGDDLGATDLVSAAYDKFGMSRQWAECAKHVLEDVDPDFPSKVQKGDIVIAGQNLGIGHAHYYTAAIMGAHTAGLSALFAESVGGLFQRAAIDLGVPIWPLPGISELADTGEQIEIDLATGEGRNLTTGKTIAFKPVSPIILDILDAGGSTNWALRRIGRGDDCDGRTVAAE